VLLRVGFTAIRQLAAQFGLPVPEDPDPTGPLELTRAEFDEAAVGLAAGAAGLLAGPRL
jgi:hypothetical protein